MFTIPLNTEPLKFNPAVLPSTGILNCVPLNVVTPEAFRVIVAPVPEVTIPPANVFVPVVVSVRFAGKSIVPVNVAFTVIALMFGEMSRIQVPRPRLLNIAVLPATGTEAPPAPPEVVDQLAGSFQLPGPAATQKRFWEYAIRVIERNNRRVKPFFIPT